jgi:hypothetical protein
LIKLNGGRPRRFDGLIRQDTITIGWANSQVHTHYWRPFLWLDFDLSGLPCSPRVGNSQKGYFSGKKNFTGRHLAALYGEHPKKLLKCQIGSDCQLSGHLQELCSG